MVFYFLLIELFFCPLVLPILLYLNLDSVSERKHPTFCPSFILLPSLAPTLPFDFFSHLILPLIPSHFLLCLHIGEKTCTICHFESRLCGF